MIKRTHLALGLAVSLYFLPFVNNKLLFIPVVILSSLLPNLDSGLSKLGKRKMFKSVEAVFTHRGPLHSYTLCILLCLIVAFIYPIFSLPFFLGYSFHLFIDSFTVNGIRPFWPLKFQSSGLARNGGLMDRWLFIIFLISSAVLFLLLFVNY